MIMQAQMEAKSAKYTPDIQLMTFQQAEEKRNKLETQLTDIKQEWESLLE